MAIAKWLFDDAGVPAENLHLFLSTSTELPNPSGFTIGEPGFGSLNPFLREQLPVLLKRDELLLVYWAGHGITVPGGDRVLLYRDYSEALATYALSLNEWQETLGDAARFQGREQLLIVDACANRIPEMRPQPQQPRTGRWASAERYLICSVQEGDYAEVEEESGTFSRHLIEYLKQNQLKRAKTFFDGFKKDLENQGKRYFTADLNSASGRLALDSTLRVVARGKAEELAGLLRDIALPFSDIQRVYQKTIEKLKIPELWNITSIPSMVDQLKNLEDSDGSRFVPRPLAEFAMRIIRSVLAAGLNPDKLNRWSQQNAAPEAIATIEQDLDDEASELFLIVAYEDNPMNRGELAAAQAWIYPANFGKPLSDVPRREIQSWDEARSFVIDAVRAAEDLGPSRLHLHFLVSAPMLLCEPHKWVDLENSALGGRFSVVLRSWSRFKNPKSQVGQRWRTRAAEIRKPQATGIYPVGASAGKELVDAIQNSGVYYLSSPVRVGEGGPIPPRELRTLKEMIDPHGVPFVVFMHENPAEGGEGLSKRLQKWLQDGLDRFPGRLCDERANLDEYAGAISVLWDDPLQVPKTPPVYREVAN